MDYKKIYYPESRFGGFADIDGTIAFYTRVKSFINSSSVILDVGCGFGVYSKDLIDVRRKLRIFRGECEKVIGIDVDEAAKENPFLDAFGLIENSHWPVEDQSIDVCICDNVLEHIEKPDLFFSECQRVLKHGGYLCIRTPNALGYVALISRLIPNKFHVVVTNKVQDQRIEKDVFPVFYRCNTKKKISRMFNAYGFDGCAYGYEAEPSYLSFSRFLYFLGVIHQRFMPNMFKLAIFAFGRKK